MPTVMQRLFGAAGLAGGLSLPRMRPFKEMGAGGVSVWGGYIRSIERNVNWSGRQRYITTSDIVANVSIVAASVHYFMNVVSRPSWSVVPADDTPKAAEYADFVDEVLYDMETPWPRIIRRATSYRFHGFSIQEWTAKKLEAKSRHRGKGSKHHAGGGIGISDIEARPQHTIEQWVVDDHGEVEGVWQRSPQTQALLGLPRSKLIYLVDDALSDSPEGLGAFRHLAEPYSRLKQFLALETRAFERDLRGTPIGRAPITLINEAVNAGNLTRAQGDVMIRGMQDFIEQQVKQADTGMLLDSMPYESDVVAGRQMTATPQWSMELLQGSANGLQELHAAIDRLQREMARIFGTEHLMLGESAGSRALSQDKSRNLYLSANAVLSNIVEAMTQDLIDPLWNLNGFPEELKPWFKAEDVAPREVGEITAALREMATAGAVLAPDDDIIDDIRDLLGVSRQPERKEEEMDAMVRSAMGLPSPEEEEMAAAGATGGLSIALDDARGDEVLSTPGMNIPLEKAFDESKVRRVRSGKGGGQFTNKPKVGVKPGEEKIPKEFLIRVEVAPDVWITLDRRKLGGKTPRAAAEEKAIKEGKMRPRMTVAEARAKFADDPEAFEAWINEQLTPSKDDLRIEGEVKVVRPESEEDVEEAWVHYDDFEGINRRLREGTAKVSDDSLSQGLYDLIESRPPLAEDIELYRRIALNRDDDMLGDMQEMKPGEIITDTGFMATTSVRSELDRLSEDSLMWSGDHINLTIRAKEGDKVFEPKGADTKEVVFQVGTNLKYIGPGDGKNEFIFETAGISKAFDESKVKRTPRGRGGGQFATKPKVGVKPGEEKIPAEFLIRVEVEPDVWITLDKRKLGGKTPREAAIDQAVEEGKIEQPKSSASREAAKMTRMYHGTSDQDILDDILANGFVPGGGDGADVSVGEATLEDLVTDFRETEEGAQFENMDDLLAHMEAKGMLKPIVKEHVYLAKTQALASNYAMLVSNEQGGAAVVFEVEVPSSATMEKDPNSGEKSGAYRIKGKVPPEWIRRYRYVGEPWTELKKAAGGTYYIPIVIKEDVEKFDPNQPRHPKGSPKGGQWRDADAGASPEDQAKTNPQPEHMVQHEEGDATRLLAENWEDTTEEELMASLSQAQRDAIAWAEAETAAYPSTMNTIAEGGFKNLDGTWTEARKALHREILEKFFNAEAVARATPAAGESPQFVFTGGRPAAGKTSALLAGKSAGITLDTSKYLTISADSFQEFLPGYKGHLAGRFNPEGQYLAEQAELMARQMRLNTIYDATMKSTAPALKRVQELKDDGWVVKVYFTHTTPQTAARRSISRFMGTSGRYVPPKVSMNSLTNEQTFDAVRPYLDEWALFDNNGSRPRLVASGGSGR